VRHGQKALVLIAILVGAGLSPLRRSHGRDDTRRLHPCTNKTLQGTYGIQIQGTQPSWSGGPIESIVGVVLRTYDGLGQFTQVSNVKGSISGWVPDRVSGGTYDVSADCTAFVHAQPRTAIQLEERLVIVDDARELRSQALEVGRDGDAATVTVFLRRPWKRVLGPSELSHAGEGEPYPFAPSTSLAPASRGRTPPI